MSIMKRLGLDQPRSKRNTRQLYIALGIAAIIIVAAFAGVFD